MLSSRAIGHTDFKMLARTIKKRTEKSMVGESVLIVEDDQTMGRALRSALEANAYRVRAASTCADGLEMALGEIPALLILDVELPDGTGWNLLDDIREAHPQTQMKVIIISSTRVSRAQLRNGGISRFIPKPFDMAQFVDTVDEVLNSTT